MPLTLLTLLSACLIGAAALGSCAGASRPAKGVAAPRPSTSAHASSLATADPPPPSSRAAAPVRSAELLDGQRISDAVPWKEPTGAHPLGTLLLATEKSIHEVNLESLRPLRQYELSRSTERVRLAATRSGAIAAWQGEGGELHIETFDAELRPTQSLTTEGVSCVGVGADGDRAVVVSDVLGVGHELAQLEISTGRVLSRRRFPGTTCAPMTDRAHVLVRDDRVYYVKNGPTVEIRARSIDLAKSLGSFAVFTQPEPLTITNYTAIRAWGRDLFFSIRDRQFQLTADLRLVRELPESHAVPSFDPQTGRALYRDGSLADRHGERRRSLMKFEQGIWIPDSDMPESKNEWVAWFFWGGRAVFVTQPPSVRLTVVDVEAKLRAEPVEWADPLDEGPYFWN